MGTSFKERGLKVPPPARMTAGISHAVYLADHVTGLNKNLHNLVQTYNSFLDERVNSSKPSRHIASSLQHLLHWALSLSADLQDEAQIEIESQMEGFRRHG
jgi:hypothetical protein